MSTDSIIEPLPELVELSLIAELPCVTGRANPEEHMYQLRLLREFDRNYLITPAKIRDLWVMASRHKVLFSDYTDGKFLPFFNILMDPRGVWMEVAKEGSPVGVIYFTAIIPLFDADFHFALWDSIGAGREPLALFALDWAMQRYGLHRVSAHVPVYQRGTLDSAERVGFVREGVTREGVVYRDEWVDLVDFGILRSEVELQMTKLW